MMRRVAVLCVLLASLLPGCANEAREDEAEGPILVEAGEGFRPTGETGALPRMRFAGTEFDATQTYEDAWPSPNTCFLQQCPDQEVRFDLTAQVPPGAPVDLTATIDTDDVYDAFLEVEEGSMLRWSEDEGLAATLVVKPGATVTLVLVHHSVTSRDVTAGQVAVVAEVRTAVRPDVVPAYLPMLVDLRPGDRLLAMGADVEDLVVVPPGQDAVHEMGSFAFNVTDTMPTGTYVIMVKGGEGMLHGPNVTLRPALITWVGGEPRPIPSGQDLTWTVAVPGIPVAAGISVGTPEGGVVSNTPGPAYMSSYTVRIDQAGREILAGTGGCNAPVQLPACYATVTGLGYTKSSLGTPLFPEGMGRGDLEFTVTNGGSQGHYAVEWVGYIDEP